MLDRCVSIQYLVFALVRTAAVSILGIGILAHGLSTLRVCTDEACTTRGETLVGVASTVFAGAGAVLAVSLAGIPEASHTDRIRAAIPAARA